MADGPWSFRAVWTGRLSGFCDAVRAAGVPVGLEAELDLGRATSAIDLLDPEQFRSACGATLARSPDEWATVSSVFDRFWRGAGDAIPVPWSGADTAALRPARDARSRPRRRAPPAPEEDRPPVAVPIGTYSAAAPSASHSIAVLTEPEMRAYRRGARRFRRECATAPGRRRERSVHGSIELRATIRRALRHGGEVIDFARERPRTSRAHFAVLWDVSGSMREHESQFFALAHELAAVSRPARVFAFSTRVEEITPDVRRFRYRRATQVVGARLARTDGGTRIGRSLEEFEARFGGSIGDRTTLVLLSDGWDLGDADTAAEVLGRLRHRVDRIVWVTPYTRRPGFEPRVGALTRALPHLDALLGPEDFTSRRTMRPFRGRTAVAPAAARGRIRVRTAGGEPTRG